MNANILKQVNTKEALILIKSAGLRRKYENVLIKRYVEDKSCIEIADDLGIEVESARNLVSKARKKFEQII